MAARRKGFALTMFILMLVGGLVGALGYFFILKPEKEAERTFVEGKCVILGKELIERKKSSSGSSRKKYGGSSNKTTYRPEFHIRHEVAGTSYEARTYRIVDSSSSSKSSHQAVLDRYETGKSYPCWYDPDDPARVVLEKGVLVSSYLITGVGGLLFAVGAGGILLGLLRALAMGR